MSDEIDRIMAKAMDADMRKQMDKGAGIYMTSMAAAAREALKAAGFKISKDTETHDKNRQNAE